MVLQDVPDHQHAIERVGELDQLASFLITKCERFLDEYVFTRAQCGPGTGVMESRGGCHDDCLDVGGQQFSEAGRCPDAWDVLRLLLEGTRIRIAHPS
jgi:hypothetical protein